MDKNSGVILGGLIGLTTALLGYRYLKSKSKKEPI